MFKVIIFDYGGVIFDSKTSDLVPGVKNLMERLAAQGYKLALVSKAEDVAQRRKDFRRFNLERYLSVMDVFPLDKPKDFSNILKKLNVKPVECLVLGDYVQSEIKEANKLGMTTVWFRNGEFPDIFPKSEDEQPDSQIESLDEFEPLLSRL